MDAMSGRLADVESMHILFTEGPKSINEVPRELPRETQALF
jgi:hypothetical protein